MCPAVSERYDRGAVARGVWRVRWAQGGACPAVSERYDRGAVARGVWRVRSAQRGVCPAASEQYIERCCCEAFGGFGGPMAGCARQFRSGTIEVLPARPLEVLPRGL